MLANIPEQSTQQGLETTRTKEIPAGEKHMWHLTQGLVLLIIAVALSCPTCSGRPIQLHRKPCHVRRSCFYSPAEPHIQEEKAPPTLTSSNGKDLGTLQSHSLQCNPG